MGKDSVEGYTSLMWEAAVGEADGHILQVTQLRVFVSVLDVNDNAPEFPFTTKEIRVEEVRPAKLPGLGRGCGSPG